MRTKTNNRKEVKRTQVVTATQPISNVAAGVTALWASTGVNPAAASWYLAPTQGVGDQNVIGDKYNLKYGEIIFGVRFNTSVNIYDYLRIMVVRQRMITVLPTPANLFVENGGFWAPLDSKNFDIQYDKIFPINTGLNQNPAVGTTFIQSVQTRPMKFRFIVPLKKTMRIDTANAQFPLTTYILATTFLVNTIAVQTESCATYYFTDP